VRLADQKVTLTQSTRYPWDGHVRITVEPERTSELTICVRIPGWAREQAVPSDLYRFAEKRLGGVSLRVGGQSAKFDFERGYARLRRTWREGDTIALSLPMPVRRVLAHDDVVDDRGRVALQRGPIVYCAEGVDNGDQLLHLLLPDETELGVEHRHDLLGGVTVLRGEARLVRRNADGAPALGEKKPLVAIPYYAWAHRDPSPMTVWLPRDLAAARPVPAPTIASRSKVRASGGTGIEALNDQLEPRNSIDHSNLFFHWWPRKGTKEWVEYAFPAPTRVTAVEVYWFDDTGIGECRLPASWRLLARVAGKWQEVERPSGYGIAKDIYNRTTFAPVETDTLRLEVQFVEKFSGGIHEWRVQ
jgi:hypothetical protein